MAKRETEPRMISNRSVSGYEFKHLRGLREAMKFNHKDFAIRAELAKGLVGKIERGQPVSLTSLRRYCGVVAIDVASLFSTRLNFSVDHPVIVSVTRGVQLKPAQCPSDDRDDSAWTDSITVVTVGNLHFSVSANAKGPVTISLVELSSENLGALFFDPMHWTHWVSTDRERELEAHDPGHLGFISRFGQGSTITSLTLAAGSEDQHEVLFTSSTAQRWKRFVRDVLDRMLEDDLVEMKIVAHYRIGDEAKTTECRFKLRSSSFIKYAREARKANVLKVPEYMQIDRLGGAH